MLFVSDIFMWGSKARAASAFIAHGGAPRKPRGTRRWNDCYRRNLAIGAGIDEGSQSTRKLSYPEIKNFRQTGSGSNLPGLHSVNDTGKTEIEIRYFLTNCGFDPAIPAR